METLKERNLCVEAGCRACCCINPTIGVSMEEASRIFPKAVSANRDELPDLIVPGVYVADGAPNETRKVIRIVGPCPHLNLTTFYCNIYPDRPGGCEGLEPGSETCGDARDNFGLPHLVIQK